MFPVVNARGALTLVVLVLSLALPATSSLADVGTPLDALQLPRGNPGLPFSFGQPDGYESSAVEQMTFEQFIERIQPVASIDWTTTPGDKSESGQFAQRSGIGEVPSGVVHRLPRGKVRIAAAAAPAGTSILGRPGQSLVWGHTTAQKTISGKTYFASCVFDIYSDTPSATRRITYGIAWNCNQSWLRGHIAAGLGELEPSPYAEVPLVPPGFVSITDAWYPNKVYWSEGSYTRTSEDQLQMIYNYLLLDVADAVDGLDIFLTSPGGVGAVSRQECNLAFQTSVVCEILTDPFTFVPTSNSKCDSGSCVPPTLDRCEAILELQSGVNESPGCYAGDAAAPAATDPYGDQGQRQDAGVATAGTYAGDAAIAENLYADLAGAALVATADVVPANASDTGKASLFLSPGDMPNVSTQHMTQMPLVAQGTFKDGSLSLNSEYSDVIRNAAQKNGGYVNLLMMVASEDRIWEQSFVRRIAELDGRLVFLNNRGEVPGRFLIDMYGEDSYASEPVQTVEAAAITCATQRVDEFIRNVVLGEAHAGHNQNVTFAYAKSQGAAQTIDVLVSSSRYVDFSISGEYTKAVGTSRVVNHPFPANYNGNPTSFRIVGPWSFREYKVSCSTGGPSTPRYRVEPYRWEGSFTPGSYTGRWCVGPMKYLQAFGRRVTITDRNENSMRWRVGATIYGVSVGAENSNATTVTHQWYMGEERTNHWLCGTDANPPYATRTFSQQ